MNSVEQPKLIYICKEKHFLGELVEESDTYSSVIIPKDSPWSENDAFVASCMLRDGDAVHCPICEMEVMAVKI